MPSTKRETSSYSASADDLQAPAASLQRPARTARAFALDLVDPVLLIVGLGVGLLLALRHILDPGSPTMIWVGAVPGWELGAFTAFGTLGGFKIGRASCR